MSQNRPQNTKAIFAYGSLIWRPDFEYVRKDKALVIGYHRSLCIYSHVHRGTPQKPGLVMGLDRGGQCEGVVYHIATEKWEQVHDYLQKRELINGVYEEKWLEALLDNGESLKALAYCVVPTHHQYAGSLNLEEKLQFIRHSHGQSGANPDYVINTYHALQALDIEDNELAQLNARLSS